MEEKIIKKRIYLAGPDVFYPDSLKRRNKLLAICEDNDFTGIYPGDNDIVLATASKIRETNIHSIKSSHYVLANLNPFRGVEPDSGTVFEVGYAIAIGKTVVGYAHDTRPMIERLREYYLLPQEQTVDRNGLAIEDFDLPANLMFGHIIVAKSAQEGIIKLKNISSQERQ